MRRRLRRVAVDVDHDHGPAVAQRPLVGREVDQLVHQREVEGPPQPAEPARHAARSVHPVGALLAAQHVEVARCEPGGLELGQRRGGRRCVVDDREEPVGRVADGASWAGHRMSLGAPGASGRVVRAPEPADEPARDEPEDGADLHDDGDDDGKRDRDAR